MHDRAGKRADQMVRNAPAGGLRPPARGATDLTSRAGSAEHPAAGQWSDERRIAMEMQGPPLSSSPAARPPDRQGTGSSPAREGAGCWSAMSTGGRSRGRGRGGGRGAGARVFPLDDRGPRTDRRVAAAERGRGAERIDGLVNRRPAGTRSSRFSKTPGNVGPADPATSLGAIRLTGRCWRRWSRRQGGKIVNIERAGRVGQPGETSTRRRRAASSRFTKSLGAASSRATTSTSTACARSDRHPALFQRQPSA